jgi:hypothetical protein
MRTSQKTRETITTIGIDLGKNTFHLVGLDKRGAIALQRKVSRSQLEHRLSNVPRCLIGMEACSGSHHIGRQLTALGHDVRLIPAQYVKPFLKGHKNDCRDAEAIAEAVQRPTMSFVAIKTPEQMDLLALHRVVQKGMASASFSLRFWKSVPTTVFITTASLIGLVTARSNVSVRSFAIKGRELTSAITK